MTTKTTEIYLTVNQITELYNRVTEEIRYGKVMHGVQIESDVSAQSHAICKAVMTNRLDAVAHCVIDAHSKATPWII